MKYIEFTEFLNLYYNLKNVLGIHARLGQVFINMSIKDSSSPELTRLFNETDDSESLIFINDFMVENQWTTLPVVREDFYNYIKETGSEQPCS